jgi:hypothetical protein
MGKNIVVSDRLGNRRGFYALLFDTVTTHVELEGPYNSRAEAVAAVYEFGWKVEGEAVDILHLEENDPTVLKDVY